MNRIYLLLVAMCHSSKWDCDQLIDEFNAINERIKRKLTDTSQ